MKHGMMVSLLIMYAVTALLLVIGVIKNVHQRGFVNAYHLSVEILPLVCFAVIITGFLQVLIPAESIAHWIGSTSSHKGILIGTLAGMVTPGEAYVSVPLTMALMRSGADIGTATAYLTSWSVWMISRLPMEIGVLGWRFTVVRLLVTGLMPVITGFAARVLFSWLRAG